MVSLQDVKSSKTAFINRTQQCFAVKGGVDGFLDLARSAFCRITEQIHQLAEQYRSQPGTTGLSVGSTAYLPGTYRLSSVPVTSAVLMLAAYRSSYLYQCFETFQLLPFCQTFIVIFN